MLKRNIYYTGVTRAEFRVHLVGSKKALYMAISNSDIGKRKYPVGSKVACRGTETGADSRTRSCIRRGGNQKMMKIFENWTFTRICRNHLRAWLQTAGKRHNGGIPVFPSITICQEWSVQPARSTLKALLAVSAIIRGDQEGAFVYRQCRERLNGIVWVRKACGCRFWNKNRCVSSTGW